MQIASQSAPFRLLPRLDGMAEAGTGAETLQVAIIVAAAEVQRHDVIDL
jgi:hypothetical protein